SGFLASQATAARDFMRILPDASYNMRSTDLQLCTIRITPGIVNQIGDISGRRSRHSVGAAWWALSKIAVTYSQNNGLRAANLVKTAGDFTTGFCRA
ncbi:UNVERIFIED_CONTAM: hypothetical protein ODX46_14985, partial [Salmonella enterica subsp. enterica serovar Enteritidis]